MENVLTVVPDTAEIVAEVYAPAGLGRREHRRAVAARPSRLVIRAAVSGMRWQGHVEATVDSVAFTADPNLNALESAQFLRVLRSGDVLDAQRHPQIAFAADFQGDRKRGELAARVQFRGREYRLPFTVQIQGEDEVHVQAEWRGTHQDLGLKPYRALLGLLKLDDALTIRLSVMVRVQATAGA